MSKPSQGEQLRSGSLLDDVASRDAQAVLRQLETVTNNATLALFIMDEQQHCTYMNPAAESLTGYTLAELQGRPLHDVIHHTRPDGTPYPLDECPIDRAFPENMQETGEDVFVHKTGHFYPVAFTASPVRDDGRTVGTVIEVQDISERKRAEAERVRLLTSEMAARAEAETQRRRLNDIFMQAPALVAVLRGPEHVFELVNPGYVRISGRRDANQLLGKSVREAFPEVEGQGYFELLDNVYRTGQPFIATDAPVKIALEGETELNTVYLDFVYQATRDAAGEVDGILFHGVDVTEKVRARERVQALADQLAQERERFASIFNQSTAGIAQADVSGRFVLVNDCYCAMTGRSREELLGLRMQDITHPDDLPQNLSLVERMLQTHEPFVIEKRYLCPDGGVVWVRNSVGLIVGAHGPQYILAVADDISPIKAAEAAREAALSEAQEQRDEAKRAHETLRTFLGVVAHDLRAPLTSIVGYAQALNWRDSPELAAEAALAIQAEGRRMDHMIGDLVDAARIGVGQLHVHRAPTDLVALARRAIDAHRVTTREHQIVLDAPERVDGLWDSRRLAQVLDNLLGNAIKFTPTGGEIRLTIEVENDAVIVSVRDSGTGIRHEDLPRLFELFGRLSTDEQISGAGLGLYICRGIVAAHNGRIWAESEGENAGATFRFTLPLNAG